MLTRLREQEMTPTLSLFYERYQPIVQVQVAQPGNRGPHLAFFEINEARAEIQQLATLKENWDGYGAIPIQKTTMRNAVAAVVQVLLFAPAPADIAPNPNGTVSLEWQSDFGTAQLEIGETRCSFFMDRRGGTSFFWDGSATEVASQIGILISSSLFPPSPAAPATTSIGVDV
jgi:hypothetical protein